MSWRTRKSHSAPSFHDWDREDLASTYRDILSEGYSLDCHTTASWVPEVLPQSFKLLRSLMLFGMAAAGGIIAAWGVGLLGYLLLTRALTPAQDLHTRTLLLDYSHTDLLARAAFLPFEESSDGLQPAEVLRRDVSGRFLPAGQRVDVWVELRLPQSAPNCKGGMVQVLAELATLDGQTVARTSKPQLLRREGCTFSPWRLATAPLRWVGLVTRQPALKVPLFQNYRDKQQAPFMAFQLAIKTRDPSWSPEVMGAEVKVLLRMSLWRRVLYMLRPGTLLMLLLGVAALASVTGGSTAAVLFLGLLLYSCRGWTMMRRSGRRWRRRGRPRPVLPRAPPTQLDSTKTQRCTVGGRWRVGQKTTRSGGAPRLAHADRRLTSCEHWCNSACVCKQFLSRIIGLPLPQPRLTSTGLQLMPVVWQPSPLVGWNRRLCDPGACRNPTPNCRDAAAHQGEADLFSCTRQRSCQDVRQRDACLLFRGVSKPPCAICTCEIVCPCLELVIDPATPPFNQA